VRAPARTTRGSTLLECDKGQRPSDKKAKRVLGMHADGLSYRLIARNVGLSKNTVMDIVRRNSAG
jgi:DNA-binding NarL/FixJ family response regulator